MQVKNLAKLRRSLEIYNNIKIITFKFCRKSRRPVGSRQIQTLFTTTPSCSIRALSVLPSKWRVTCKAQLQYKYIHTFRKAVFINIWNDIVYEVLHEFLNLWSATAGPQAASFFDDNELWSSLGQMLSNMQITEKYRTAMCYDRPGFCFAVWLIPWYHVLSIFFTSNRWHQGLTWFGRAQWKTKCATLIIDDLV